MRRTFRGASPLEYGMLIIAVAAALLAMKIFLEKIVGGRWRQAADSIGYGLQYGP